MQVYVSSYGGIVLQIVSFHSISYLAQFVSCSRSHLNVSHVLNTLESAVVFVFNDSLALPVSSDDFVSAATSIKDCGHLEGEKVDVWLDLGLFHGILANVV